MISIRMARHYDSTLARIGYERWMQRLMRSQGWSDFEIPWHSATNTLEARVNGGLWVVFCPTPDCHTQLMADDQFPLMFCPHCFNVTNQGQPYHVEFAHQAEVEQLFAKRADPRTRNWLPEETLDDLIAEQRKNGEL